MKFARLLIAAAILAGLGGLVWWSNRSEDAKAGKADPKAVAADTGAGGLCPGHTQRRRAERQGHDDYRRDPVSHVNLPL